MTETVNLIGVYSIAGKEDVHLLEFNIETKAVNIQISKFTQRRTGVDRSNWQVPWDEKYLNSQGTKITGDWLNVPKTQDPTTRIAFYFHYLDFNEPFITPFGEIRLTPSKPIPTRLSTIITYIEPD